MVLGAIRKILESFRPIIRLNNIHVRYEDLAVDAVTRLALGVTVGKLIVQHPDSPHSEIDEDPAMMPVKDVVDLEVAIGGVGVYMHTGSMGAKSVIGGGPEAQALAARKGANAHMLTGAAAKRWAATNGGEDDRTVEAMGKLFAQLMKGETPFGAQQWLVRPIAISGKVHVNVGIFIGAPTRFNWGHMVVADLIVEPIKVAVSAEQASSLVIATSELMLMPARYLYQMLRPKRPKPLLRWRAAINAVLSALVELSGATRLKAAIRDRTQYQKALVDAMAKMRERDAQMGTELEDVMHIALWRLVAWAQAKDDAEKGKLEGRGKRRMSLTSLKAKAKPQMSADELMAASSEMNEEAEEEGEDPLADAPADFEMAVANMQSDPNVKTITETVTTANLDGSITTTTKVTTFRKPVNDQPLSTVLGLSLSPIVVRARVAPKTSTGIYLCVGDLTLEHQVARGSDETQPLIRFHGTSEIPDTSPLLGPPKPVVEVPRPKAFGFLQGGLAAQPKPKGGEYVTNPPVDPQTGERIKPTPPALHLVATLPPEPTTPGEFPPNGSTKATLVIHRGEARVVPHQLRDLFAAFFVPLDKAMDLIPGAALTREMVAELAELAEGFVVRPWWGISNALPAVIQGVREAVNGVRSGPDGPQPGLMGLDVTAKITEGLTVHLLGEPAVGTALGARHTVPLGTVTLPPLEASLFPVETEDSDEVHLKVGLLDDVVLSTKKHTPSLRPLSGPGAAPIMDPSRLSAVLLSEQLMLLDELKAQREANSKLAAELQALQAQHQAHAAEGYAQRLFGRSAAMPTSPAPPSPDLTALPAGLSARSRTAASGPQSNKRLVGLRDAVDPAPLPQPAQANEPAPASKGARGESPKRSLVGRMIPRRGNSPSKKKGADANASTTPQRGRGSGGASVDA